MFFSIGHSNRNLAQLITMLRAHDIDVLADVRGGAAGSRMFPHFNSSELKITIPNNDISYVHLRALGGRRPKNRFVDQTLNDAWRVEAFKNYADAACTCPMFAEEMEELVALGTAGNVAYMCAEAVPWRCHRTIITDYLILVHDQKVTHILGEKQTMEARPNKHAVLRGDKVVYPSKTLVDDFFDL